MSNSKIFGRATAIFGGKIGMTVGLSDDLKYAVIGLCEMVEDHEPGDEIQNPDNYGEQVTLAFDSIRSINNFRNALDVAERCLKDGKLPEEPPSGFMRDEFSDNIKDK